MQVAYVGGLGLAFGVNAVTRLGQPAVRSSNSLHPHAMLHSVYVSAALRHLCYGSRAQQFALSASHL